MFWKNLWEHFGQPNSCSYRNASNFQIIPPLEPELECSSPMLTAALPMNLYCIQTQLLKSKKWGDVLNDVNQERTC